MTATTMGSPSGSTLPAPPLSPTPAVIVDAVARVEDALMALVQARYGLRLDDSRLVKLRESISALQRATAALYEYPLTNADEPDFVFRPYREGE